MDLSKILAISGKPGLYKILSQSKGGVIIESLIDGRRMAVGQSQKVSTLSDIQIYTTGEEVPLSEVFSKFADKAKGKDIDVDVNDNNALRAFFADVLPDHDQDRVYASDIRKMLKWFILLQSKNLITEDAEPAAAHQVDVEAEVVEGNTADTPEGEKS